MTIPDWLQSYLPPPDIMLAVLACCALIAVVGIAGAWILLRRQNNRSLALEEQLDELQSFLQQQYELNARSIESSAASVEDLKKSVHEQARVLESLRASSNVSEHWDALEKLLVFTEQLDKMSRDINVSFSGVIDELKSQQSERVRLAQNGFKIQTDQARKVLEKTIAGKLTAAGLSRKDMDQLSASIIDSIRYSMLTVGKHHQDNLNKFARVLLDDLELKIHNGLRNTFYRIEDLKQKTEQFTQLLGSDWNEDATVTETATTNGLAAPELLSNDNNTATPGDLEQTLMIDSDDSRPPSDGAENDVENDAETHGQNNGAGSVELSDEIGHDRVSESRPSDVSAEETTEPRNDRQP